MKYEWKRPGVISGGDLVGYEIRRVQEGKLVVTIIPPEALLGFTAEDGTVVIGGVEGFVRIDLDKEAVNGKVFE